jgi:hypothetical protein
MSCDELFCSLLTTACALLSAVVSERFPLRHHLQICGRQELLQRWKQMTTEFPRYITNYSQCRFFSYKFISHMNQFSAPPAIVSAFCIALSLLDYDLVKLKTPKNREIGLSDLKFARRHTHSPPSWAEVKNALYCISFIPQHLCFISETAGWACPVLFDVRFSCSQFRRFHINTENFPLASCVHPSASARISAAPTGRVAVKFDIGDYYHNLLRNSEFG